MALSTRDIVGAVAELRRRCADLPIPRSYYDEVPDRIGRSSRTSRTSAGSASSSTGGEGYLLQIFTQALGDGHAVLRADRAPRLARLRRGQLQGALPGSRARAGEERESGGTNAGQVPAKRHVAVRQPTGNGKRRLLVEEVAGYEGFSGNETILYHNKRPARLDRS